MPESRPSVDDMSNVSGPRERLAKRRRGQQPLGQTVPDPRYLDPTQSMDAFQRKMAEAIRPRYIPPDELPPFFRLDEEDPNGSFHTDASSSSSASEDFETTEITRVPVPPNYPKPIFRSQQQKTESTGVEGQSLTMSNLLT